MSEANFITATDVFNTWKDDIHNGSPPVFYSVGEGELENIEIGPQLVTLIGGAPGAGKTAFTMQCVFDALRLNQHLKVLICNVEMPPSVLLDRQLARLSGIDAKTIRYRQFDPSHDYRLQVGLNAIEPISDRLCFLQPPFSMFNIATAANAFEADLIVIDYIQRIQPNTAFADKRSAVDDMMNNVRQLADSGRAMVVISAVSRQRGGNGNSSYEGKNLSLASFRESSELEFGADNAYILTPQGDDEILMKHLKARHSETRDIELKFERQWQSFTPISSVDSFTKIPTPHLPSFDDKTSDVNGSEIGGAL